MHADLSTIDDFGKFEVCKQSRSYLFGGWGIHLIYQSRAGLINPFKQALYSLIIVVCPE